MKMLCILLEAVLIWIEMLHYGLCGKIHVSIVTVLALTAGLQLVVFVVVQVKETNVIRVAVIQLKLLLSTALAVLNNAIIVAVRPFQQKHALGVTARVRLVDPRVAHIAIILAIMVAMRQQHLRLKREKLS